MTRHIKCLCWTKGTSPSLISRTVSVDVKHHVYLLKGLALSSSAGCGIISASSVCVAAMFGKERRWSVLEI